MEYLAEINLYTFLTDGLTDMTSLLCIHLYIFSGKRKSKNDITKRQYKYFL
jgi:hypothetical protein